MARRDDGDYYEREDRTTTPAPTSLSYDFLGYDGATDVYRGSDGQLYQGDPSGPNGFSPYTGSATTFSDQPSGNRAGTPPPGPPGPTGGPPPPGPNPPPPGPNLLDPFTGQFQIPNAQYPIVPNTPNFYYPDFIAPTFAEAQADPGFEFGRKTGEDALLHNRAARGILGTGGALKDLLAYNSDYASQRYGDVYQRKRDVWNLNRQNALDMFAPQMTAYTTLAQAGQRQNELDYARAWERFNFD